jgi:hypothetical protein
MRRKREREGGVCAPSTLFRIRKSAGDRIVFVPTSLLKTKSIGGRAQRQEGKNTNTPTRKGCGHFLVLVWFFFFWACCFYFRWHGWRIYKYWTISLTLIAAAGKQKKKNKSAHEIHVHFVFVKRLSNQRSGFSFVLIITLNDFAFNSMESNKNFPIFINVVLVIGFEII